MATSTIKSNVNVRRGTLTLSSPFALRSWGHATYVREGSLLIINITAFYCAESLDANTPICTFPFQARNWQGQIVNSSTGERMLLFSYEGHSALYAERAVANSGDYYAQFIIDTY